MLNWLNQNGTAIQAIFTVLLVGVTTVYVILTRSISRSAANEIKFQNQAKRTRFLQLDIILERIIDLHSSIPKDKNLEHWVRTCALFSTEELNKLNELQSEFISSTRTGACLLDSLNWIIVTVSDLKKPRQSGGINWEKFDYAQFYSNVADIEKCVKELKADLNRYIS